MRILTTAFAVFCIMAGAWALVAGHSLPAAVLLPLGGFTGFAANYMLKLEARIAHLKIRDKILADAVQDVRNLVKVSLAGGVLGALPHGRHATWRWLLERPAHCQDSLGSHIPELGRLARAFEEIGQPVTWEDGSDRATDWVMTAAMRDKLPAAGAAYKPARRNWLTGLGRRA